jgi:uncharacterized membrane protein (UPF0136 family)
MRSLAKQELAERWAWYVIGYVAGEAFLIVGGFVERGASWGMLFGVILALVVGLVAFVGAFAIRVLMRKLAPRSPLVTGRLDEDDR